jgi:hypothetical protein
LGGNLEVEVDHAELAAIVRQGAALLAQEPASSQSGEPESEDVEPLIADGLHGRSLGDSELRRCFTEPEPAEDRSKPAPFAGDDGLTPLPWAQGFLLSLASDLERLDERRAETLRRLAQSLRDRHDAQQAGKGGE